MRLSFPALLALSLLLATGAEAQWPAYSDPAVRAEFLQQKQAEARDRERRIADLVAQGRWQRTMEDATGARLFLADVTADGLPIYRQLLTTRATIGAAADIVHAAPYSEEGDGILIGVWDGGPVLTTHQEFNQTGSTRITNAEGTLPDHHATAVTGVIMAGGVDATVLGAAPRALAECYDLLDDIVEMTPRIAASPDADSDIFVSNHAYGDLHGWQAFGASGPLGAGSYYFGPDWTPDGLGPREDLNFGRYGEDAEELDTILFNAQYYLFVKSAGNDRNQNYTGPTDGTGVFYHCDATTCTAQTWISTTAPFADFWDDGGYDTMIDNANGKNTIAVGAITDATTAGVRDPGAAAMAAFSCWGPTDDGRVKPDIVSRGVSVRSHVRTNDTAYTNTASGTSFSAPNVTGTLALFIGLIERELGTRLRGSTLKGLLLHTATDIGRPGPDYQHGWGLPDAAAAGALILGQSANADALHLVEGLLDGANPADTYTVNWDGSSDLVVTVCWYDPPASALPAVLDNPTPALVNDIDLRVTTASRAVWMPWVLDKDDPTTDALTGDNTVDNIEQIIVPAGADSGAVQIDVTHKGVLQSAPQWYSLFVSGQSAATTETVTVSAAVPAFATENTSLALEVQGGAFRPGSQARLVRAGFPDIELTQEFSSPERLFGALDLAGAAVGYWDVEVTRADGTTAAAPAAFEVRAASAVKEWLVIE